MYTAHAGIIWNFRARGTNTLMLMLLAESCIIKSYVSDPGVPCLLQIEKGLRSSHSTEFKDEIKLFL